MTATADGPTGSARTTRKEPLKRTRSGLIVEPPPAPAPDATAGRGRRLALGAAALLALLGILAAIVVAGASPQGSSPSRSVLKDVGFVIGESRGVGIDR